MLQGPLQELMDYWRTLPRRDDLPIPMRKSFDPGDIADILPRISLLKRTAPDEIIVGLVGTEVNILWDKPITGLNVFDLTEPQLHGNISRFYNAVLSQPCGAYVKEVKTASHKNNTVISTLYLPMTDRLGVPNYILGCSLIHAQPKSVTLKDRLLLDTRTVESMFFIDVGFGVPNIAFEPVTDYQPPVRTGNEGWWSRFMSGFTITEDRPTKFDA